MKKYLFLLLIGLTYGATAQDLKIKVTSSTDYSRPKYAAKSNDYDYGQKAKFILGYSINVEAEQQLAGIISWFGGVGYKQKRFRPLGTSTITEIPSRPIPSFRLSSNFNPEKHQIHLLSIPLGVKLKSRKTKKVSPYIALGLVSDFLFSESETYNDGYWPDANTNVDIFFLNSGNNFYENRTYTENEFDYYGTAVSIGFGLDVAVSGIHTISFFSDFNAIEYRKKNQRMNSEILKLWDNSFYMFGEISLGLGVQCRL